MFFNYFCFGRIQIGLRTDLESCYLLGDFGTTYKGNQTELVSLDKKLAFGDVVTQGLAFYGGNINYQCLITIENDCDLTVSVPHYRGIMATIPDQWVFWQNQL